MDKRDHTAKESIQRVYLDYAAATPVAEFVYKDMEPYWSMHFANPSAIHQEGVVARNAINESRQSLASVLGVRSTGVMYTGSGTESNTLAISGVIESLYESGVPYADLEIVSTEIEHPSVSAVLEHWKQRGVSVKYLPLTEEGRVELASVEQTLSPKTCLVTCAYVNSEIGTVQPLGAIARIVRAYATAHTKTILMHTDAAQAPLWLPCSLVSLGVDMMSLDAGKCYGPKGVGVLAVRHGVSLSPVIRGGGQEFGLRSGTENTPLIIGASTALVTAQETYEEEAMRVVTLRDETIAILKEISGLKVNGSETYRVANNINVSIEGIEAEFAVISLDEAGIAIATKSACSGSKSGGSAVIRTITGDNDRSLTTLRVTLGRATTQGEMDMFVEALKKHVKNVRTKSPYLTQS